ncbi:MAG TPA: ClpX C4-type zinc finger protein [Pseudolabrys sp.]|nr:ClpX C4-type zinc finger protein [Pseudolabrys sp.]
MEPFEDKRFDDALLLGMASYLISRELGDEDARGTALISLQGALERVLPDTQIKEGCSFCGRKPPEVRLAAVPSVFICDACVSTLSSEVFEKGG